MPLGRGLVLALCAACAAGQSPAILSYSGTASNVTLLPTTGGARVSFVGSALPTAGVVNATFGSAAWGTTFRASCQVPNNRTLECTTPPGYGANWTWTVTYRDAANNNADTPIAVPPWLVVSYRPPELSGVLSGSPLATTGGRVSLTGVNLGAVPAVVGVRMGPSPTQLWMRPQLVSVFHNTLVLDVPSGGGATLLVQVSVANQSTLASVPGLAFRPPAVSDVVVAPGQGYGISGLPWGWVSLEVSGRNFGPVALPSAAAGGAAFGLAVTDAYGCDETLPCVKHDPLRAHEAMLCSGNLTTIGNLSVAGVVGGLQGPAAWTDARGARVAHTPVAVDGLASAATLATGDVVVVSGTGLGPQVHCRGRTSTASGGSIALQRMQLVALSHGAGAASSVHFDNCSSSMAGGISSDGGATSASCVVPPALAAAVDAYADVAGVYGTAGAATSTAATVAAGFVATPSSVQSITAASSTRALLTGRNLGWDTPLVQACWSADVSAVSSTPACPLDSARSVCVTCSVVTPGTAVACPAPMLLPLTWQLRGPGLQATIRTVGQQQPPTLWSGPPCAGGSSPTVVPISSAGGSVLFVTSPALDAVPWFPDLLQVTGVRFRPAVVTGTASSGGALWTTVTNVSMDGSCPGSTLLRVVLPDAPIAGGPFRLQLSVAGVQSSLSLNTFDVPPPRLVAVLPLTVQPQPTGLSPVVDVLLVGVPPASAASSLTMVVTLGSGVAAAAGSPVAAVDCAVALRNATHAAARCMLPDTAATSVVLSFALRAANGGRVAVAGNETISRPPPVLSFAETPADAATAAWVAAMPSTTLLLHGSGFGGVSSWAVRRELVVATVAANGSAFTASLDLDGEYGGVDPSDPLAVPRAKAISSTILQLVCDGRAAVNVTMRIRSPGGAWVSSNMLQVPAATQWVQVYDAASNAPSTVDPTDRMLSLAVPYSAVAGTSAPVRFSTAWYTVWLLQPPALPPPASYCDVQNLDYTGSMPASMNYGGVIPPASVASFLAAACADYYRSISGGASPPPPAFPCRFFCFTTRQQGPLHVALQVGSTLQPAGAVVHYKAPTTVTVQATADAAVTSNSDGVLTITVPATGAQVTVTSPALPAYLNAVLSPLRGAGAFGLTVATSAGAATFVVPGGDAAASASLDLRVVLQHTSTTASIFNATAGVSFRLRYRAPKLTGGATASMTASGRTRVVLTGTDLGQPSVLSPNPSISVALAPTALDGVVFACGQVAQPSSTQLACEAPAGIGAQAHVAVNFGNGVTASTSTASPAIAALELPPPAVSSSAVPTNPACQSAPVAASTGGSDVRVIDVAAGSAVRFSGRFFGNLGQSWALCIALLRADDLPSCLSAGGASRPAACACYANVSSVAGLPGDCAQPSSSLWATGVTARVCADGSGSGLAAGTIEAWANDEVVFRVPAWSGVVVAAIEAGGVEAAASGGVLLRYPSPSIDAIAQDDAGLVLTVTGKNLGPAWDCTRVPSARAVVAEPAVPRLSIAAVELAPAVSCQASGILRANATSIVARVPFTPTTSIVAAAVHQGARTVTASTGTVFVPTAALTASYALPNDVMLTMQPQEVSIVGRGMAGVVLATGIAASGCPVAPLTGVMMPISTDDQRAVFAVDASLPLQQLAVVWPAGACVPLSTLVRTRCGPGLATPAAIAAVCPSWDAVAGRTNASCVQCTSALACGPQASGNGSTIVVQAGFHAVAAGGAVAVVACPSQRYCRANNALAEGVVAQPSSISCAPGYHWSLSECQRCFPEAGWLILLVAMAVQLAVVYVGAARKRMSSAVLRALQWAALVGFCHHAATGVNGVHVVLAAASSFMFNSQLLDAPCLMRAGLTDSLPYLITLLLNLLLLPVVHLGVVVAGHRVRALHSAAASAPTAAAVVRSFLDTVSPFAVIVAVRPFACPDAAGGSSSAASAPFVESGYCAHSPGDVAVGAVLLLVFLALPIGVEATRAWYGSQVPMALLAKLSAVAGAVTPRVAAALAAVAVASTQLTAAEVAACLLVLYGVAVASDRLRSGYGSPRFAGTATALFASCCCGLSLMDGELLARGRLAGTVVIVASLVALMALFVALPTVMYTAKARGLDRHPSSLEVRAASVRSLPVRNTSRRGAVSTPKPAGDAPGAADGAPASSTSADGPGAGTDVHVSGAPRRSSDASDDAHDLGDTLDDIVVLEEEEPAPPPTRSPHLQHHPSRHGFGVPSTPKVPGAMVTDASSASSAAAPLPRLDTAVTEGDEASVDAPSTAAVAGTSGIHTGIADDDVLPPARQLRRASLTAGLPPVHGEAAAETDGVDIASSPHHHERRLSIVGPPKQIRAAASPVGVGLARAAAAGGGGSGRFSLGIRGSRPAAYKGLTAADTDSDDDL